MVAAVALVGVSIPVPPAHAVEYRLQVVSLWESAFTSFLKVGELGEGASGPGLDRLQASLDQGRIPSGVVLYDRPLRWSSVAVAQAYGAVRVLAEIKPGGEGEQRWDEVKWNGKPGERSVWMVIPSGKGRPQQLYHVALKGTGPIRHFTPYVPARGLKVAAASYPLNFLWGYEDRGPALWDRYLSRSLDLTNGIGAVIGENTNRIFADQAYLVIEQAAQPTTYKAVLVWREPGSNLESPSIPGPFVR